MKLKDRLKDKPTKEQVKIAFLSYIDTFLRGLFKLSTHIVLFALMFVLILILGVFYGLQSFLMLLVVGFFSIIFGVIFTLVAFPDARRIIMNVLWRSPLAMVVDEFGRIILCEGKIDDAGFLKVKLGKIIYRFAYQAKHIYRWAGSNLFLAYINWAGGLPPVALAWANAYENDKDHRQQHLDDIEMVEAEVIDETGQVVKKMVPKETEEEHLKKIKINTPCYALIAASDILKLVRESLPPEMLKYLELAYQAKAKAGLMDFAKLAAFFVMVVMAGVVGIAIIWIIVGSGGGISLNMPGMPIPSGVMP